MIRGTDESDHPGTEHELSTAAIIAEHLKSSSDNPGRCHPHGIRGTLDLLDKGLSVFGRIAPFHPSRGR